MIYSWGNNRRFNSYVGYFKKEFGGRVQKLSIDAGFTCPNRDGTKGTGGCTYCNNEAFNPSYCIPDKSITQQIAEGISFHSKRYKKPAGYLAYFQAYSNTYNTLKKLKEIYSEAINYPGIIGLIIGTRPDCIDEEKLDYFKELSQKIYIVIEYGVESCYDKTLLRINRGHNFETSVRAIEKTNEKGIKTGAHFIFGLPGENRDDMLNEADIISKLPLHSIKFHQLQIIKNTALVNEFKQYPNDFDLFQLDEYIDFMVSFIEKLNPQFVVERIAGESPPYTNISPVKWGLRNDEILRKFEKKLEEKDTWQGKYFKQ